MKRIVGAGLCVVLAMAMLGFAAAGEAAVSQEEAAKTALGQLENGKIVRSELRYRRDGRTVYKFTVINDSERVEIKIDGADGKMLEFERKPIRKIKAPAPVRGSAAEEGAISIERASEIALERSGGGEIVKLEREYKKHGRILYEIEIYNDGTEYEMEIDGQTGEIVEYQEERFDEDDDDDYRHVKRVTRKQVIITHD